MDIPTIVDIDANILMVVLDHLTEFAAMGKAQMQIFLPLVLRNHQEMGSRQHIPKQIVGWRRAEHCPHCAESVHSSLFYLLVE
ncbi:MAG: hypothetical protein KKD28_02190 [Chloroflexi bacterium]|nr:hypothetical protein [Chloroflexota bacterium]MBU1660265.1 hypothetical protein [Chloroflexota bacterium]